MTTTRTGQVQQTTTSTAAGRRNLQVQTSEWKTATVFGGPSVAIGLAPGGQDPVSYLILLTVMDFWSAAYPG